MSNSKNSSLFSSATLQPGQTYLYAEVIIPLLLPITYTWAIPGHLQEAAQIGIRVEVDLRNKKYAGIIKTITKEKPAAFQPKELLNILDDEPLLYQNQLKLWNWMSQYYMCSEGEVMQAAVPANLKLSSQSILIWNEETNFDLNDGSLLSDNEFIVAQALEIKKELRLSEVHELLDTSNVYPVIKKLIEKQICFVWEELQEKYKSKTETYILLNPIYHDEEKLSALFNEGKNPAPKQMELLLAYLHIIKIEGEVTQPVLLKKANASAAQLKGLIDKGILKTEKRATDRIKTLLHGIDMNFELSAVQQAALDAINTAFTEKNVCLLHGVTASGKTQAYMKLIEQYMQQGKQVLYMLPEIALTAQMIRRLQVHFGGNIAIYHSKFNPNERVEIWNKVKSGQTKVVLGARSSIFLPFKNLGLIVVDEEHDASYKQQDPAPRYHARDSAIYYASLFGAKVLLGSATPSIESYYNCLQHKYSLVTLAERFGNVGMPTIELVDLKKIATKDKSKIALSPQMIAAIEVSLSQKKQVILFQNRRGYSPYMICNNCGWIPQCQYCNVSLTYHKSKNKLSCHYCGTTYPVLHTCAACGSHNFIQKNFGTEKIEEMVAEQFPNARVARMDYDTVKGKNAHDNLIKLFEQQRIDILVGTQMVAKGLDFEHVNLVGIIDGDGILHFADFRVNERAFQLMEQVSGRAGRKDGKGNVLIQVSNVQHPVLAFVQNHNYLQLYNYENEGRKAYQYPPFFRIIQLTFKHKDSYVSEEAANILLVGMQKNFKPYLHGPAQPPVDRVRNQYLWEILIKLPKDAATIQQCKREIQQQIAIIQSDKRYRAVSIVVDVDPV
ncbi:primosomal protein N' [Parasediminibacterium sp. JCM 36343]|uniref:replication restart helicase PriA n=1 Tax=Parasediminibacterium sp. JCM 36343 TaxID=3374279 RepID=UPI00397C874E